MAVDEKDKREKYVKSLYESTELPEAFMGLQVPHFQGMSFELAMALFF